MERTRSAKEKQMREEAVPEKEEMERQYAQLQKDIQASQDALVCIFDNCVPNISHTM